MDKTAKEMFEELEFTCEKLEFDDAIKYYKKYPKTNCILTLIFDSEIKECFMEFDNEHKRIPMSLNAPEVKAIHQEMEELGWLDE